MHRDVSALFIVIINFMSALYVSDGAYDARSRARKTGSPFLSAVLVDNDDSDRYHVHRKHAFNGAIVCKGEWKERGKKERKKEGREERSEKKKRARKKVSRFSRRAMVYFCTPSHFKGGSLIR